MSDHNINTGPHESEVNFKERLFHIGSILGNAAMNTVSYGVTKMLTTYEEHQKALHQNLPEASESVKTVQGE
ncbi:hypothetical protein BH10PAT3_BH10PAT3_4590 [soil metagenome]